MQRNALVIGAGGGIGAAMVDALAADGRNVYAIARRAVSSTHPSVSWLEADATDSRALEAAVGQLPERIHDLFITLGRLHGKGIAPEKSIKQFDAHAAGCAYYVNAVAPLHALQLCLPHLTHDEPSAALILSAQVGSIGDNHLGGWYAYRMAKAALNQGIKTTSIELARTRNAPIVTAVHPGTTATPLSAPFIQRRRAHVASAFETAQRIVDLSHSLTPEHNGRFLKWDGTEIEW